MHRTSKSSRAFIGAIIAGAGVLLSTSAADFKAYDYATPAYVDLEFGELRVNEPAKTISVNILRTGDFRQTTTIDYKTGEETASEGQDYKGCGGTITFKPGEGFKTVTLEILADADAESPESFRFEITGSSPNTMVLRGTATIVIEDAPVPVSQPRLQIAPAPEGNILLAWDGSPENYLERTTDPVSGAWEPVVCTPAITASRCEVLQPRTGKFYFYRLRTP